MKKFILLSLLIASTAFGAITQRDKAELGIAPNYIANGGPEQGTAGFSKTKSISSSGSFGGCTASPTHISFSSSTSSPLAGSANLVISNSGSTSAQNECVTYDFTIDAGYQGHLITTQFLYQLASGTFVAGTSQPGQAPTTGDMDIWIYDKTNGVLIQPASNILACSSTTVSCTFQGVWQASINSTSYTLIFHIASTNTSAWSQKIRSLTTRPVLYNNSPIGTDWQSYTPTITGFGTVSSVSFFSRRIGDSLEIFGTFTSGTPTAVTGTVTLGYAGASGNVTTDSSKMNSSAQIVGYLNTSALSTDPVDYVTLGVPSTSYLEFGYRDSGNSPFTAQTGSNLSASGRIFGLHATVPIQGWATQSQVSNLSSEGREVTAIYYASANQIPGSGNQINFDTKVVDTMGSVTTGAGAWKFTAPIEGDYHIDLTEQMTTATGTDFAIHKNGTRYQQLITTSVTGNALSSATMLHLNVGDYIDVRVDSGTTLYGGAAPIITQVSIKREIKNTTITPVESVNAAYGLTSNVSPGTNGVIKFDTKQYDSHGSYNTSTGLYTAYISGKYHFCASVYSNTTATNVYLYKNGSPLVFLTYANGTSTFNGCATISLNTGDTAGIYENVSSTILGNTSPFYTYFSVERVGN